MHYWLSPTVVIDQCTEESSNLLLPSWLETVGKKLQFWQSRILVLEMMLYFGRNIPHNSQVSKRVATWCSAMSVSYILLQGEQPLRIHLQVPLSNGLGLLSYYPSSALLQSHLAMEYASCVKSTE